MKKYNLLLIFVLGASLLLTACADGDNGASDEPTRLVLSTWGFNEDLLREHIYEPFEEEHNVEIVLEVGNNSDRLNKLRLGTGEIDLIQLAEGFAVQAIEEGLFEEIDRSNIPNIENLYDVAKAPFGEEYGPAYTIGRYGLMYDSEAEDPVTSWEDLWRDDLNNRVIIPDITTTAGPFLPFIVADLEGLDVEDDIDAIFDRMAEIRPNLVKIYTGSAEVVNMLTQGEATVVAGQDFSYGQVLEGLPTAEWVDPEEGAYAIVNTTNVVKGSENKELAEKFINWMLDEEVQKSLAIDKVDSPANRNVVLTEEEAEGLTYGADVIESLVLADWMYINEVQDEWIDRWNREISTGQ